MRRSRCPARADPYPRAATPQPARCLSDVERLDAKPVAAERHHACLPVSDREREHPLEVVDTPWAPFVERLQQHFAVGGGEEAVARPLQFGPQLLVVVDAAV